MQSPIRDTKVLVTGATGHSGHWFMKKLASEKPGEKISCLVRPTSDRSRLESLGLNIDYVSGNLADPIFLSSALANVEVVIHFAGIHQSRQLVQAAKKSGVNWLILVHTTGRFSKFKSASSEYIEIEDWVMSDAGVNYTILRPTMIFGSRRDRNIWKLIDFLYRHKLFPVFGSGKNLMQPIHARDVGEAVYLAWQNREKTLNRAYDIAGRYPLTYRELLNTVSRQLGRKNIFVHVPYWISYLGARAYNFVNRKAVISVEQVMRMNEDKVFDYSAAARDFGYAPVGFKEGIIEEINEYLGSRLANKRPKTAAQQRNSEPYEKPASKEIQA